MIFASVGHMSLFFLVEPTSGLDSTTAFDLIEMLREVALEGKTVITSIHQPSSQIFQSFDQLILLADGQTIFMVRSFCVNGQTKEILLDVLCVYRVDHSMRCRTLAVWVISVQHSTTLQTTSWTW